MTVARQLVEYVGRGLSFRRSGTNSEIVSARISPLSAHQLVIFSIDVLDLDHDVKIHHAKLCLCWVHFKPSYWRYFAERLKSLTSILNIL